MLVSICSSCQAVEPPAVWPDLNLGQQQQIKEEHGSTYLLSLRMRSYPCNYVLSSDDITPHRHSRYNKVVV